MAMCSTWNHNCAIQQESGVHPGGLKVKVFVNGHHLLIRIVRSRDRTIRIGDFTVVDASDIEIIR